MGDAVGAAGLDAAGVRDWCAAAVDLVTAHRAELDALNVFPVPDSDTGANVQATLAAGSAAAVGDSAGAVLQAAGAAAAAGARGNSGILLAEVLRGLAAATEQTLTAAALRAGLRTGTARAYAALAHPVEGTLLSVAAAAARAAEDTPGDDPVEVVAAARDGAAAALVRTREQLPELTRAGVVDAGGRALCLVLDALLATVSGQRPPAPASVGCLPATPTQRYEVQYAVRTGDVDGLRSTLDGLGDSLIVVPLDGGDWSVHVHTADAGAAIEAGLAVGAVRAIRVGALPPEVPPADHVVVAVGLGPAVGAVLAGAGVLVDPVAVPAAAAAVVLAATDDAEGRRAAGRLRSAGLDVAVVPVRSPVQALAAAAVHDPVAPFRDAVVAMAEAAAATRWAEVTVAAREAQTSVGRCAVGAVLGLAEDDVVLIGTDVSAVACELLDRLLSASGELVTLVAAPDGPATGSVRAHLAAAHRTVEVVVYTGAQRTPPLLIGVE